MTVSKILFTPFCYTGWGALEKLFPELDKLQPTNILFVTDPILLEVGVINQVTEQLEEKGYRFSVYSKIEPEPSLESGESLVKYTRENTFDAVIGIGGGSALDLAKLAAVMAKNAGNVADYLNLSGKKRVKYKGLPKILIPTTSGTGSEVTNISVLSHTATKDVVTHDYLLADLAIIDPALTVTVPKHVTAATGIDALTHAIEAYLSTEANPTTDGLALHAIRLIGRALNSAVKDGKNKEARTEMSYGSYMAGLSFFNAGVGGVHALAYPLGGQFHLSHGESNAVLLPYVMDYIEKNCRERMKTIYEALGGDVHGMNAKEASRNCVSQLKKFVEEVGLKTNLKEFGISESALDDLTGDAVNQKRLLARSPLPLERQDIRKIYEAAYKGVITLE